MEFCFFSTEQIRMSASKSLVNSYVNFISSFCLSIQKERGTVLVSQPLTPLPPTGEIYLSDMIFWVELSLPRANTDM